MGLPASTHSVQHVILPYSSQACRMHCHSCCTSTVVPYVLISSVLLLSVVADVGFAGMVLIALHAEFSVMCLTIVVSCALQAQWALLQQSQQLDVAHTCCHPHCSSSCHWGPGQLNCMLSQATQQQPQLHMRHAMRMLQL